VSQEGGRVQGEDDRIYRVGVISDTHGRLDEKVLELFVGVDRIVHAGDVGDERVLARLALVATVTAVHGNMDAGLPTGDLPTEALLEVGRAKILVGHVKGTLLRAHDPSREGIALVVTGHTHRAQIADDDGVLYLNPGTANRARAMGRPASVALVEVDGAEVRAGIVPLEQARPTGRA
jgi:putative phosphoesterase